jgi:hypothetical protein
MEFYAGVFGGELTLTTFAESGAEVPDAECVMQAASFLPGTSAMWLTSHEGS